MKISFDLDDTLIPGRIVFPTEEQNAFQKSLGIEPVREGAIKLMKQLKSEGIPFVFIRRPTEKHLLFVCLLDFWNIVAQGHQSRQT